MTEILRQIEGNLLGLDKDHSLLVKGLKLIFDHLGTEKTLEIIGNTLYVNGISVATGASDAFDPSGTGLISTTKSAAIAELKTLVDAINAALT